MKGEDIVGGSIAAACRMTGTDPKNHRVKLGGKRYGGNAVSNSYIALQTHQNVSINTKPARDGGFVRRTYEATQVGDGDKMRLIIQEWDAAQDNGSEYRTIWEAEYTPASHKEFTQRIADDLPKFPATGYDAT